MRGSKKYFNDVLPWFLDRTNNQQLAQLLLSSEIQHFQFFGLEKLFDSKPPSLLGRTHNVLLSAYPVGWAGGRGGRKCRVNFQSRVNGFCLGLSPKTMVWKKSENLRNKNWKSLKQSDFFSEIWVQSRKIWHRILKFALLSFAGWVHSTGRARRAGMRNVKCCACALSEKEECPFSSLSAARWKDEF